MSEPRKTEEATWVSRYQDLGQGTAPIPLEPSPFEKAMADYGREKRRAVHTLLGSFGTVFFLFAATFFSLGRWSIPDEDRLVLEPSLKAEERVVWEDRIASLKAENIDLRLAVREKETTIEDLGKLIWSWVEKERRRGIETEIPFEVGQKIPSAPTASPTALASLSPENTAPRP